MTLDIHLVGIGTGSHRHLTLEGRDALKNAKTALIPLKGEARESLARLRHDILVQSGFMGRIVHFDYPERDPALPYLARVEAWHDEIARRWQSALKRAEGPVALLVWGDPALYDSTLRIARRLDPAPRLTVVPGITAIAALTAAHRQPLNAIGEPVLVTTGRRLAKDGWPKDADSVVVMLDGEHAFEGLKGRGLHIWWGACLGSDEERLLEGPLDVVAGAIVETRKELRDKVGWVMDTYLLRGRSL